MKQLETITRTYPSGFKAQIIIRPQFIKKFMGIIVDFGGSDPQKIVGSAHFLEHKLFAKSDGDISKKFEEINATTNAFTSYNETMFYANFIEHWPKVLPLLFELVGTTNFSSENVKKESEIIAQELAMYQDDPNWKLNYELMQMMFPKTNLAEDLTGTKKALGKITPKTLQEVYKNNYVSGNMQFVACGDFSENQVKTILREVGKLQETYIKKGSIESGNEDKYVSSKKDNINIIGKVSLPRFGLTIKLPEFKDFKLTNNCGQTLLEMMFEARLGEISPWFENAQRIGLLSSPLYMDVTYTRQGNFVAIYGASDKPSEALKQIKSEIEYNQTNEELFNLLKKDFLAKTIRNLDNIETSAIEAAEMSLEKDNLNQLIMKIQTLSFNEFCIYFSEIMAKSDTFTGILETKSEEK